MKVNDESEAYAELMRQLSGIDGWLARTDSGTRPPVTPTTSAMGGDDTRLHPYEISHASSGSLSHAADHLRALRALLATGEIPMFAPYTLIRPALESASVAVWLLEPTNRAERITRRLRLAAADIKGNERARALTGQTGPKPLDQRLVEVRQIAAKCAGVDEAASTSRLTSSEIVETVGAPDKVTLLTWNVCSGMAHGDFWAKVVAAQMVQMPEASTADVGAFAISAKLRLLAYFTTFAVQMSRRGWELYDQRSRSR